MIYTGSNNCLDHWSKIYSPVLVHWSWLQDCTSETWSKFSLEHDRNIRNVILRSISSQPDSRLRCPNLKSFNCFLQLTYVSGLRLAYLKSLMYYCSLFSNNKPNPTVTYNWISKKTCNSFSKSTVNLFLSEL